jgi:hypothetical protein
MITLENLFYSNIEGKRVKSISPDLLLYLDDIALAYWAMDDGLKPVKASIPILKHIRLVRLIY